MERRLGARLWAGLLATPAGCAAPLAPAKALAHSTVVAGRHAAACAPDTAACRAAAVASPQHDQAGHHSSPTTLQSQPHLHEAAQADSVPFQPQPHRLGRHFGCSRRWLATAACGLLRCRRHLARRLLLACGFRGSPGCCCCSCCRQGLQQGGCASQRQHVVAQVDLKHACNRLEKSNNNNGECAFGQFNTCLYDAYRHAGKHGSAESAHPGVPAGCGPLPPLPRCPAGCQTACRAGRNGGHVWRGAAGAVLELQQPPTGLGDGAGAVAGKPDC